MKRGKYEERLYLCVCVRVRENVLNSSQLNQNALQKRKKKIDVWPFVQIFGQSGQELI